MSHFAFVTRLPPGFREPFPGIYYGPAHTERSVDGTRCTHVGLVRVTLGAVDPEDESHNCDAMGCGIAEHVVQRVLLDERTLWPGGECPELLRLMVDADVKEHALMGAVRPPPRGQPAFAGDSVVYVASVFDAWAEAFHEVERERDEARAKIVCLLADLAVARADARDANTDVHVAAIHRACPDHERLHTPVPYRYAERLADANVRFERGERQQRCPTCSVWAVWVDTNGQRVGGGR